MIVVIQFPYKYGGGYVANQWVQNYYRVDRVVELKSPRRSQYFFDLVKLSYKHRNDKIILNGLLSFPFGLILKKIDVVINHNVESYLFNSIILKLIIDLLQKRINNKSLESIFFNERDAETLSIKNYKICTPIIEENACELPEKLSVFNSFIPSNLTYGINIKGLTKFYLETRSNYPEKRFIISTQSFDTKQCEYLLKLISKYGDELISLPRCQYIKALEIYDVFLIVYEGSGIQLKALEAFVYSKVVYATKFIIDSDERFISFREIF